MSFDATRAVLRRNRLVTVCEEAACPNIGECWGKRHATVHDHGRHLHARLRLLQCADRASPARSTRPSRRASAAAVAAAWSRSCGGDLGRSRRSRRRRCRSFRGDHPRHPRGVPRNHRSRCSPRTSCAKTARSKSSSTRSPTCSTTISRRCRRSIGAFVRVPTIVHSLNLLEARQGARPADVHQVRHHGGLGRGSERKLHQVMDDLRAADVDFLTIGQYLQPTRKHAAVRPLRHAGGVRRLQAQRRSKRLPARGSEPSDPLIASCGRGLRPAQSGPPRSRLL